MPNTYGLNRTLGGAIGAIALVSLLSSGVVLATLNQSDKAVGARLHSNQIIRRLDAFRSAMLDQETGIRGYLLTGKDTSLEPYRAGVPALDDAISQLRLLIGTINPAQTGRLADAEAAARTWQNDVAEPVLHAMADPATRAQAVEIEAQGRGKQLFDHFRQTLIEIQGDEQKALANQSAAVAASERNSIIAVSLGTLVTLLICGGVGVAINRLIVQPLVTLSGVMRRLTQRDLEAVVPNVLQRNEVGEMARSVEVFKKGLIELDRTSLLRATADTLPAMVGYVTAARRIGFLNSEFMEWFDLKTEDVAEVYGRPLAQVFAFDPFPGASNELEAAFAGVETRFEHRLARRGMARRDVEGFYRPHRSPDGTILGVVTLLTDITDRKRLERRLAHQARELLRSNEELEQFAYVASHDLKAPLRGIENLVSWIEEDLEGSLTGDTRTNMELLKSRVRRLESLLDDLLAYSRAGRAADASDLVDTGALVQELAVLVSPPEGFTITAEPSLPTLQAPRAPLTQVLQNLIGNAIKHHDHPSDGHVWVEAASITAEAVEFVVTDDGPGIPARFHDRVFGMFQTLRPRDEVEGSGMGLAIVKKLVERQGGKIWLTEGRDGRGLSVHFAWPTALTGRTDGAHG